MRKLCLALAFLLFLPAAEAATTPYPTKLEDFTSFENFQDAYLKIYQDVHFLNLREIWDRVKEHPEVAAEGFTEMEVQTLCDLDVPEISFLKNYSLADQTRISQMLEHWCNYEENLFHLQNDLARRGALRVIFSNDSEADSPFDLAVDLRRIDALFFGEKYEDQAPKIPKFSAYREQSDFLTEPEKWEDQREEILKSTLGAIFTVRDFGDFTTSLTGTLAGMKEALQMLLSYALVGGKSTKYFFELPSQQAIQDSPGGAGVGTASAPSPNLTLPEIESVQKEILSEKFPNLESAVLWESNCPELFESGSQNIASDLAQFESCGALRESDLSDQLKSIRDTSEAVQNERFLERLIPSFGQWNQNLSSFLENAVRLRLILEELVKKPQK